VLSKSGSWYSYGDDRIGQGRENTKQFLSENIDMRDKLENDLRAALGLPSLLEVEEGQEVADD
jgi:recombination protein RecA